jgi:hypothetical protein
MIKTQQVAGQQIEEGDYAVVDGFWYRLDQRLATNPELWAQRFVGVRKNGEEKIVTLRHNQDFQVYREA